MRNDFQHEKEGTVLRALRNNVLFNRILDIFHTLYADATFFAELPGRNFLVTEKTEPALYELYRTAAERLEVSAEVPVYLSFDYKLNAEIVGTDENCAIVISSECMDKFSEEQMLAVFGHALTHIHYGHVSYLNMDKLMDVLLGRIPLAGDFAGETLKTLLLEWRLAAEYTADRGAAVAAGRMEPVLQNLICNMGGSTEKGSISWNIAAQKGHGIPDITGLSKIGQGVCQILSKEFAQPFGNIRILELQKWCGSQKCKEQFSYVYYRSFSRFDLNQDMDGGILYAQAKEALADNVERGMALLHAAAEKGYPGALTNLARSYLQGKNTLTRNSIWGLTYMRRAALMNDPAGLYGLGICFQKGLDKVLPANRERADWLFCMADERGHPEAGKYCLSQVEKAGFPEKKFLSVLTWLERRYTDAGDRSCRVYIDGLRGEAVQEDPERIPIIRDYLWIPQKETIYVTEVMDLGHSEQEWAAITDYGIYRNSGRGLPGRISWDTFAEGELVGVDGGNTIELRLNNRRIMNFDQSGPGYSIPRILIKLKNVL